MSKRKTQWYFCLPVVQKIFFRNIMQHLICQVALLIFICLLERTMPCCPEEAISLIEKGCYQTNLYLGYGPNALNIVIDPKSLDITEVEKVIEEVCHSHNIQLINPFSKTT